MNPRPDRTQIPEAVAESVDRYVDSLDGLEILVFLSRGGDRAWTGQELAEVLGIPLSRATRSLQHFAKVGLCAAEPAGEAYRYAPRGPEEREAAARILNAYKARRVALINYVASEALSRIRALGEAFRVNKGGSDD